MVEWSDAFRIQNIEYLSTLNLPWERKSESVKACVCSADVSRILDLRSNVQGRKSWSERVLHHSPLTGHSTASRTDPWYDVMWGELDLIWRISGVKLSEGTSESLSFQSAGTTDYTVGSLETVRRTRQMFGDSVGTFLHSQWQCFWEHEWRRWEVPWDRIGSVWFDFMITLQLWYFTIILKSSDYELYTNKITNIT